MKILFLKASDQQHHPLHKYVDLHCTFDFKAWEEGFRTISPGACTFDYYQSFVSSGPVTMERQIRDLVIDNNIDLLIVPNLYYELAPTFLDELRSVGCRSLIVFFDCSMRFENTNRFYLSSFDYYLTQESSESKKLYKHFGIESEFFPVFPCYSFYKSVIRTFDKSDLKFEKDVVFVGARIADRDVFVNYLEQKGIEIAVYGKGWESGMLSTEEMLARFNSSKISLNFIKTIDGSGRTQLKARLFEIVMAGGFVLSEHCEELSDYFDVGLEIDTFKTPQELLDKVKFYLENDKRRGEMLARARKKVEENYSFESNWAKYLANIDAGIIRKQQPNFGYSPSGAAVNAFKQWNFSLIWGRFMLGENRLAYQQYFFCKREIKDFDCSKSVIVDFLKWGIRKILVSFVGFFLNKSQIDKVRKWIS